jgi:Ca2+-dependent lipid-binding protein
VLAVTVYSADEMRHVDELVEEAPDTYVRFYLDHGQELDRTSVCEHSFSPAWNETKYLKLNNLNSLLSLELNSTELGFKDKRLGTASFNLSQLDDAALAEQEGL